jgi:anti-sigma regulatory factor (Ser/Thr protein kinase)
LAQELRVAAIIQQTLLPQSLPDLEGWALTAHYKPAREVGGDFYDFLYFDDGRLGIVIGDVTDKGVPAALVMATTRTLLRAAAERLASPGQVLQRVNDLLHPDIPPRMFVTCLLAVLDPENGRIIYANAGHDVPYHHTSGEVEELRATGMPLGLMPGMTYEEKETTLNPGDTVLFYSDGLVEAHAPDREMFGFPRLKEMMGEHPGGAPLVDYLLDELATFTGPSWEQEDDVTLVVLQSVASGPAREGEEDVDQVLAAFEVASEPGNERAAMERVGTLVAPLGMEEARLERLKTAVAETTMNAMEHGNDYQADLPVRIEVCHRGEAVIVNITDFGGDVPQAEAETPDLLAKLSGEQSPRGWGLFLIQNMVDEMNTSSDGSSHTVELIMNLHEGGNHAD